MRCSKLITLTHVHSRYFKIDSFPLNIIQPFYQLLRLVLVQRCFIFTFRIETESQRFLRNKWIRKLTNTIRLRYWLKTSLCRAERKKNIELLYFFNTVDKIFSPLTFVRLEKLQLYRRSKKNIMSIVKKMLSAISLTLLFLFLVFRYNNVKVCKRV